MVMSFLLKVMFLVCRKSKSSLIVTIDLLQKVSRVINYQPPISLALEITANKVLQVFNTKIPIAPFRTFGSSLSVFLLLSFFLLPFIRIDKICGW